jgi:hypothetical protein
MPSQVGGPNLLTAVMVKLFGTNTAFTAHAEFHVFDKNQKETDILPMTLVFLDGRMRIDIDMNQVKSTDMPQGMLQVLRNLGMDQAVVISRPDKKIIDSIYPRAKSYAEIPMSKDEIAASEKTFKVEKKSEGKELIDGHSCDKNKVSLVSDKGEKGEATVWSNPDLKDFPVQMELTYPDSTVVVKFKEVKLSKPDTKQFEPPTGLTKYDTAEALRDALVSKGQPGGKR